MIIFNFDDIKFRLGKNAKENHLLIDYADKDDWWFHLDNHPSGHVIVDINDISNEQIIFAAQLVKQHSKLKNHKNVKVCYLQVKYIKKTKNPGEVKLLKNPHIIIL